MKKLTLLAAAAMMVCAPFAKAQVKVDVAGTQAKIAKSDEDIQNPKKNTKSATWMDRGKLFYDAAEAPAMGMYEGMDDKSATLMFGKPVSSGMEKIGGTEYIKLQFANVTAYAVTENGVNRIKFWNPTTVIADNALGKSLEAYLKAYSLDKGLASKVSTAQGSIGNSYKQEANNLFSLHKYPEAAAAFANAYDAQLVAPANTIDTLALFNAGFLYTVALQFDKAEGYLKKAIEVGYENDGDAYYYLYHCYYGMKNEEAAKDILMKGLAKFPENARIVEGLLQIYTTGDNNPNDIIPLVQKAIDSDPTNAALYSGLGLIYDKLGDLDKSIEAFQKTAELMPKDFGSHFNLGLLLIKKADEENETFSKKVYTVQQEYQKALSEVNALYSRSIDPLETALKLNPGNPPTIELLKNLTFRLRDEPGMMEKYNKYNEMFKALPAAE